jgi:glutamine synthetase
MDLQQAKKYLEDNRIKFILAQFVDIHGVAKSKAVPVRHLEMILNEGAGFAGFAVWGFGMGPHGPDIMGKGDLNSLVKMDWMPGFARLACEVHVHGKPYEYDSRVVCKRAMKRLHDETGYTIYTGLEPEFFLLKQDPVTKKISPAIDTDVLEKPCYDYQGLEQTSAFLADLAESIVHCCLDVYQIDHEDATGQYEMNFTYADALKTADNYILFKMAASSVARKHGFICSFMPKPFSNKTGNGMHMHLSLGNEKVQNAFLDDSDPKGMGLSKLAYHFLGGIIRHSPALTALCCPSVNSYKRLIVGGADSGATWAPAFICYGDNNRTASVRIPYGRIELRYGDSASNPYLVTAAVIAAGMDGIKNKLDPGKPANINLYETTRAEREALGIKALPQSLHEALQCFQQDEVVYNSIGPNLAKEFVTLKTKEWIDYHLHVSDWEVDRYLQFY